MTYVWSKPLFKWLISAVIERGTAVVRYLCKETIGALVGKVAPESVRRRECGEVGKT